MDDYQQGYDDFAAGRPDGTNSAANPGRYSAGWGNAAENATTSGLITTWAAPISQSPRLGDQRQEKTNDRHDQ